jgi:hypothetical protein
MLVNNTNITNIASPTRRSCTLIIGRKNFAMINTEQLRAKRTAAGIPGRILCNRCGIARSRLSDIERGYVIPSPADLARIYAALEDLIQAKSFIDRVAASVGWPTGARNDA